MTFLYNLDSCQSDHLLRFHLWSCNRWKCGQTRTTFSELYWKQEHGGKEVLQNTNEANNKVGETRVCIVCVRPFLKENSGGIYLCDLGEFSPCRLSAKCYWFFRISSEKANSPNALSFHILVLLLPLPFSTCYSFNFPSPPRHLQIFVSFIPLPHSSIHLYTNPFDSATAPVTPPNFVNTFPFLSPSSSFSSFSWTLDDGDGDGDDNYCRLTTNLYFPYTSRNYLDIFSVIFAFKIGLVAE